MSRCWDYDDEIDPYWKHQMEMAQEAMNDREVGLIGQCQAAADYERIRSTYGRGSISTKACSTSCQTVLAESEESDKSDKSVGMFGLPIISW